MAQDKSGLAGTWYCWHWYPSKDDAIEQVTKNRMTAHSQGRDLVLESEANQEGSYMFVRLSIDEDLATGTWYESSSPDGEFHGAEYSGAGQLIIDSNRESMEGKWAGIGYDHKASKRRIYVGRWKLARKDEDN